VLDVMKRDLHANAHALSAVMGTNLQRLRSRAEQAQGRLHALSPLNILERGYALVFDAKGKLIKDATQVSTGDEIRARLHRGEIRAKVEGTDGK
jgi:exodeoxyribonuclease VII large subunit